MSPVKVKLIVAGIAIAGAVGYLGITGVQSGWVYYVDVDEYVASDAARSGRARVHGTVALEGVDSRPADLFASFDLVGATGRLAVEYQGPVPDLFQPGREVVVEGVRDDAGVFQADVLLTKCASKYEGQPQDHPTQGDLAEGAVELTMGSAR